MGRKPARKDTCSECFKVVGTPSRYQIVRILGSSDGMTVSALTKKVRLSQPTVTHHLGVLRDARAVSSERRGRERVYRLNRDAHCFEECHIPY